MDSFFNYKKALEIYSNIISMQGAIRNDTSRIKAMDEDPEFDKDTVEFMKLIRTDMEDMKEIIEHMKGEGLYDNFGSLTLMFDGVLAARNDKEYDFAINLLLTAFITFIESELNNKVSEIIC